MEGVKSSSTTFHMVAAIKANGWGEAIGGATVKMKFGDASEFAKWAHLKKSWPEGGVMLPVDLDISVGSDGKASLTLLDVRPPVASAKS